MRLPLLLLPQAANRVYSWPGIVSTSCMLVNSGMRYTTVLLQVLPYKQPRSKQFLTCFVAVSELFSPLTFCPIVTPARAPCVPTRRESLTQHEARRQGKISLKHHLLECRLTLLLISRGNSLPAVKESRALTSTLPSHG